MAVGALGRTLMHEHVFVLSPEIQANYPNTWDEEQQVGDAIARLDELKAAGIDTIVDPTVIGLGRYIPRLQRLAEQIDLHIVVATGIYAFNDLPFFFQFRGPGTPLDGPEPMVDMFVRDIVEGIGDTRVRAAILKCATDEAGVTPGVERSLRAVAKAHRITGAPITTHTAAHAYRGRDQQEVFAQEGVRLDRVIIGHCGDTTDLAYLQELLDNGSYIGMDRFGMDAILPTEERVRVVADLCKRGYSRQMVLSHDSACYIDWLGTDPRQAAPNWSYVHIPNDVVPALREQGVDESHLDDMLIHNPRRIFAEAQPY
ncbi:MAG: phosphotriesterase family protein [Acidimicrobiia bacterium]